MDQICILLYHRNNINSKGNNDDDKYNDDYVPVTVNEKINNNINNK